MSMRVLSVNVSLPRPAPCRGHPVLTGIYKEPVAGRVGVRTLGLEGDAQADLEVHGGPTKAVYAYPSEHYAFWRAELPGRELPWGMFGENLTVKGLLEEDVRVGDAVRIGSAVLEATKPRFPCYKLGIKFQDQGMVPRFLRSGRSGFYFAVRQEGELGAGDGIELVERGDGPTIHAVVQARIREEEDDEE